MNTLLAAGPIVRFHLAAALLALVLGAWQLGTTKGTPNHRVVGWIWVSAMLIVAASSMFIHELNRSGRFGGFSPIHVLSLITIASLIAGVVSIRRGDRETHRQTMRALYIGGLVITGAFTLWPGRLLYRVFFG